MEQEQSPSLFGLNIDGVSKTFLAESARWGKFLAIIGFIVCGLVVIVGIFMASTASQINNTFSQYGGESGFTGLGTMMAVLYIIIALIYFFPCLYLFRFSNFMKVALATDDQANLIASFRNLKSMFKFVGIFTIILLSLYALAFLLGGLGAALG